MKTQRPTNAGAADWQGILSLCRWALAFALLTGMAWYGGVVFGKVNPEEVARKFLEHRQILKFVPFPEFYVTIFQPASLRYYIPVLGAMFAIFLGAAYFVRDVYALPRLTEAVRYVLSSMSGLFYPRLRVEAGKQMISEGKINLLDKIGGPGLVIINPGNAVMFRRLRAASNITIGESYFLEPFEKIGTIANLEDQHDDRNGITALTRDGIKITLNDVHYRFRIFPEVKNGHPVRRTPDDPYPFDEKALWNRTYNLTVDDKGPEDWRTSVGRVIVGGITDFINANDVDYVTAPRDGRRDPRREIRNNLFFGGTRIGLRNLGAELLWVDIGHFAIDDEAVDKVRQDYWAADWLGDAQVTRELGYATRQAYQDLGRAEAQAEILASLAEAMKIAVNTADPAANMRKILLVRTAQILETYNQEVRKTLQEGGKT